MKKKSIICIFLLTLSMVSFAQTEETFELDDSFEIEEIEVSEQKDITRSFWEQHFSGYVGGFNVSGEKSKRQSYFTSLAFQYEYDWMTLHLEGAALKAVKEFKSPSSDFTYTYEPDPKLTLRDAYLQFNFTDSVMMSIGRQTIVWGQFDMFSPVDFAALPFDFDFSGIGLGKLSNRKPLDTAKLVWFPQSSIELQVYYFTSYDLQLEDDYYSYGIEELVPLELPNETQDDQKAVRALYYADWGTVGVTYYDGWMYNPTEVRRYTGEQSSGYGYSSSNITTEARRVDRNKMLGLELSKPIGAYVWKFEVAKREETQSLREPYNTSNYYNYYGPSVSPEVMDRYKALLRSKNNGLLHVPVDVYYIGLGYDADLENWLMNIAIIYRHQDFKGDAKELYEMSNDLEDFEGMNIIPSLHFARYLDDDKNARLGLAAGFISYGGGALLYYQKEFWESLSLMVGLEQTYYFSDMMETSSDNNETENNENRDDVEKLTSGMRFGLVYQF